MTALVDIHGIFRSGIEYVESMHCRSIPTSKRILGWLCRLLVTVINHVFSKIHGTPNMWYFDNSITSQQYFESPILLPFWHQQKKNKNVKDLDISSESQYLQSIIAIRCRKLLPPSSFSFLSFSSCSLPINKPCTWIEYEMSRTEDW